MPASARPPVKDIRLIEPDWDAPAAIRACTFSRDLRGEPGESTLRDWLAERGGCPVRPVLARLKQVHGVRVAESGRAAPDRPADACFSRSPGAVCAVRTADCLPVLICDRQGGEVAAVHAGWRGLAAGVIEATLSRLHSPGSELMAWMGPAISQRHFEVGPEVREVFLDSAPVGGREDSAACFLPGRDDRYMADLYGLARLRLSAAGLEHIGGGDYCTYSDASRFHSYRRDGASAGRLYSLILIAPP